MEISIEVIENYITEFKDMLKEMPELNEELFSSEYANEEFFWVLFKEQAIINLLDSNDPSLTLNQLKDLQKNMFLQSIAETMESLKEKGLLDGDEISGYKLTDTAKIALDIENNNEEVKL
jgi:hypothetical protein